MPFKIKFFAHPLVIIGSCVGTLIIILTAGLWPFHAPKNDVAWLADEDGIRIGKYGCVLSSGPLWNHESNEGGSGSIELWIKPARATKGRRTILALEGPGDDSTALALQQSGNSLIIQRKNSDESGRFHTAEFTIKEALVGDSRVGITIAMGPQDTTVYRNGVHSVTSRFIGKPATTFAGRAMLANSLNTGGAWPGQFYGLAIYGRKLTPEEVMLHFEDGNHSRQPTITQEEQPLAVYLFAEHAGSVVHDSVGSRTNLVIPERYSVLHPEFLTPPWRHFRSTPGYWGDVAINILGFVPFGLTFYGYFSTLRPTRNSALLVVLLGFFVSLTIEVLQAWLPTRNSGMNDLITNTFGTGLGVLLHHTRLVRAILDK
jgi:VanZ family protein